MSSSQSCSSSQTPFAGGTIAATRSAMRSGGRAHLRPPPRFARRTRPSAAMVFPVSVPPRRHLGVPRDRQGWALPSSSEVNNGSWRPGLDSQWRVQIFEVELQIPLWATTRVAGGSDGATDGRGFRWRVQDRPVPRNDRMRRPTRPNPAIEAPVQLAPRAFFNRAMTNPRKPRERVDATSSTSSR